MNFREWGIKLQTITIFNNLLKDDVIKKLSDFFNSEEQGIIKSYCKVVSALYDSGLNLSEYLYQRIMDDENIIVKLSLAKKEIPQTLNETLEYELKLFEELSMLSSEDIIKELNYDGFLPKWDNTKYDFMSDYKNRLERLPQEGYGIFAKYSAFSFNKNKIEPILNPDPQRITDLIGYQNERQKVINNTLAFLQGLDSHNVLLYGDAGTGKSSTIKAIGNEYFDKGLRIIEVKKHQLNEIPSLIDQLSNNPLHFIIFIDDLSFKSNDDNFIALKNILEGGIQHRQNNIRVYATSNRRHFVKEDMNERAASEIYRNDIIQETISLAARFGLTVTFLKPNKALYEEIVKEMAKRNNLDIDENELLVKAEAFAMRNNGRSPRTAKQFIETEVMNKMLEVIEEE